MGYRQVFIKKSEKISFKDTQLIVTKENSETRIPLEDINYILLEDTTTIITARLLAELGKNAIALIVSDEKHNPTCIMFPYNYHYKQLEVLEYQLENTSLLKDQLWKLIIESKIYNQKTVIEKKTSDEKTVCKISEYLNSVELGDRTNREGLTSKIYFKSLFGSNFIRHYDDSINSALNYGYTILKSAMIRILSSYGFLTYYGINHKSKTNNFNLAYDLIEPFRAIIDDFVYDHLEELTEDLSYNIRKQLVNILNYEVKINDRKCTVEYSMELLVISLAKTLSTSQIGLSLPKMIYG